MTRIDILNYYRKLIEKSRSFCTKHLKSARKNAKKRLKKAKSLGAKQLKNVKKRLKKPIEKTRSFCAEYLNLKPIDLFLIIAVIMALVYVVVNHSWRAVSGPERTRITISSQCVDLFGRETVSALIQEFEKINPELRIQEVKAAEAGSDGDGADIVFFDNNEFGSLINVTALVSFMDLFIYNIDILQAAVLDRPPKTRAEFLAAAKAVAEKKDAGEAVAAFALGLSPEDPLALRRGFYPWIWASGVDIHTIDLSGDNPALPRPVADVIALFGQLNREGLLAPGTFDKTGAQRLQEFAEGKIAMMTISARELFYFRDNTCDFKIGLTALPAAAQGKNRLGLSSIYAGISRASAVPNEARVFLSFLVKKGDVLADVKGAVPGSYPVVFAGAHIEKSDLLSKAWDIFEAADIVDYKPGQPSEETFNRLVREKLIEVLKIEPPKVEEPKVEPPKVEPPKVEPPKVETPKAEPPAEAPQAEPPAESS